MLVATIFALVTKDSNKIYKKLARIPYIYYPVYFKKNKIWLLIDFGSKVNAKTPVYAA